MHIPQGPTAALALELFDDALVAALRPSPDYDVSRWLYVPNHYSEYRYILGTRGRKPLICMGINPSTAAPDALDPTLQSAQRIALSNGYDSFLMFNIYAQRACRLCTAACVLRAKLDSGGSSGRCTGSSCRGFSGCSSTVFSAEVCGTAGAFASSGFMVPEATACRVCASLRAGGAASPSAKSCRSIMLSFPLRLTSAKRTFSG